MLSEVVGILGKVWDIDRTRESNFSLMTEKTIDLTVMKHLEECVSGRHYVLNVRHFSSFPCWLDQN